jgi:hypothetical protein
MKHKRKKFGHKLLPVLIEAVDDEDCMPDNTKAVTFLQSWC